MKRISKIAILVISTVLLGIAMNTAVFAQPTERVSFPYFYDRLAPYGQWIELNDGLLAWKPDHVQMGWSPYAYGSWVSTRYGWYWDSTEPFGDIVYHYGRWFNDDYYGWIWIPDYDWAPAWVEWRYDDSFVGWAPLPPYAKFSPAAGIVFSTPYHLGIMHWHFVPYRRFCEPYVVNFFINERIKARVFGHMSERAVFGYENNIVVNRGIEREIIERRSRTTVRERDIVFRNSAEMNGKPVRSTGLAIEIGLPGANVKVRDIKEMNINRGTRNSGLDMEHVVIGERRGGLERPGQEPAHESRPTVIEKKSNNRQPGNMERYPGVAPERKVIKQDRKPARNDKKEPEKKREQNDNRERDRKNERDAAGRMSAPASAPSQRMAMSTRTHDRKEERFR